MSSTGIERCLGLVMRFSDITENYIESISPSVEKKAVTQLLKVDLKRLEDADSLFALSLESLQTREEYRLKVADLLLELLQKTTNSKEVTQQRLLRFSSYLNDKWGIPLVLDEIFKRETLNPYERLVDLLKTLHEGKTKKELMDYYSISTKPLEKDINALIKGTKILGQNVKIRDIQREHRRIAYQSSLHPVFLPLNLTEVFYLTVGLKLLAQSHESIMSRTLTYIADKIYCQLSDYAREKIKKKGMEQGVTFPSTNDFEKYDGSRDEEEMARRCIQETLLYAWKSGTLCTVHLKNEHLEVIKDVYVDYDIRTREVNVRDPLHRDKKRKLNIDEVLDIKFKYI